MKFRYVKTPEMALRYSGLYSAAVSQGEPAGAIVRIAEMHGIAPCLVAKLILQRWLEEKCEAEGSEFNAARVKSCLRDTLLIDDAILSYEVFLVRPSRTRL